MSRKLEVFSVVLLVLLALSLALRSLTSLYHDIGRHLRLGEIIWRSGHIPTTNLFSYTAPDHPFLDHHWLSEVGLYAGASWLGLQGLILVKAGLFSLAFGLALLAAWNPRVAVPGLWAGLTSLVLLSERTDLRPEVISFVFLGWFLFVLYRRPRGLWLVSLPLAELVWVNCHIYFFLGVWLAWGAALFHPVLGRRRSGLFLAAGVAVATLANPQGWSGATYPLHILGSYPAVVMENCSPWQLVRCGYSPWTLLALGVGAVLSLASFAANRAHLRQLRFELLLTLTSLALALLMQRNLPIFGLCMLPVVLRNFSQSGCRWPGRTRLTLSLAAALWANVLVVQRAGLEIPPEHFRSVDFFRKASLRGPILNNFDVGSFLIWALPEWPVFVDGRPEAYPPEVFRLYTSLQQDPAVFERVTRQYAIRTVFWNYQERTACSRQFLSDLQKNSKWAEVYRDRSIVIFTRAET